MQSSNNNATASEAGFHERLRHARIIRGLSGNEAARCLGVARSAYSRWESGARPILPVMATRRRIADLFQVSISWLVAGVGPMEPFNNEAPAATEASTSAH